MIIITTKKKKINNFQKISAIFTKKMCNNGNFSKSLIKQNTA